MVPVDAATSGHTYLTSVNAANGGSDENGNGNGNEDEDENAAEFYASTSANVNVNVNVNAAANANANAEFLGRTHAAHVQVRKREVHPAEWRAYGMWARPWLGPEYGDMVVRNASAYSLFLPRVRSIEPA